MNLATATEASIGTRKLNSIHLGTKRLWIRPTWPTVADLPSRRWASPLALSSTTAAVRDDASVVLYDITADTFTPRGQPIPGDYGLRPYASLSSDGNTVVIGWTGASSFGTPRVKVYDWSGTDWVQRGQTLTSTTGQYFGTKTAIASDTNKIVISEAGSIRGTLKTFIWTGTEWQEQDIYEGPRGTFFGLRFSLSLSHDGLTLAADSPEYTVSGMPDAGLVRVLSWNGSGWTPSQDITGTWFLQNFGSGGVSLDGDKLIIGIPEYRLPIDGIPMVGKVVVYEKVGGTFVEHSYILGPPIVTSGDWRVPDSDIKFGKFVSIHGNRVFFSTENGHICYDIATTGWTQVGKPFQALVSGQLVVPTLSDKALVLTRRNRITRRGQELFYQAQDFVSLKTEN